MKELNQFQCEVCGIIYKSRLAAEQCEAAHILPKKIVGHKYYKECKYADYIIIEFKDGSVGRYKRS